MQSLNFRLAENCHFTLPLPQIQLNMRFSSLRWYLLPVFALFLLITPACRTKSGCPANADMAPKTNKRGQIVGRKAKASTGLYPKKMEKKLGVKS